ncbi:phosphatidylinositol-specific phospholipase C/glycerophosphodiester phosphodiesterase family protein [Phycisphaerales bacterium AB-hyl4]|uniref:Altered inheritance of mitochondria protein 6 n=1 Tax=Natronomicrosphaera hydrolytica TaxID=3242702 RepID=A0ABV4U8D9_9BACT
MRNRLTIGLLLVVMLAFTFGCSLNQPTDQVADTLVIPGHAHNDYYHPRPLNDALDHGFISIEADIFLVDGELLVGHDPHELTPERTLQSLYLDPLRERAQAYDGRIYPDGSQVILLIDIKSDGEEMFEPLNAVLAAYSDIIAAWEPEGDHSGETAPVLAVLSGNRPVASMLRERRLLGRLDGRLDDLDSDLPAAFMPLISDHWRQISSWQGEGEMPAEDRARLHEVVRQAHAAGRRVRFWATPESEAVWEQLLEADVDLINTDELGRLRRFLLSREP